LQDTAPILDADAVSTKPSKEQISQMFMEKKTMQQEEKIFIENITGEKELSKEDIKVLSDALGAISQKKNLLVEKEEIKDIKEEIANYQEDIEELQQIVEEKKSENEVVQFKESRAAKLLFKKVNSMIHNLDKVLDDLEKKEKEIKVLIQEPGEVTEAVDAVIEEEAKRTEELVRIDEMMNAIRKVSSFF
jgi:LETM1 and EF-hand domain-containing protein 1